MGRPKERCLDCTNFGSVVPAPRERACPVNPIPRTGTCGRCQSAFVPLQVCMEVLVCYL